ncbi:MAG: hypothetical protein KGI38_12730 [Thaumarchaeota archaeon]|nr:hypothetical protein [Nitrososphaerota archaeon]
MKIPAVLRAEFWAIVLLFTYFRYGAKQFDAAQAERQSKEASERGAVRGD